MDCSHLEYDFSHSFVYYLVYAGCCGCPPTPRPAPHLAPHLCTNFTALLDLGDGLQSCASLRCTFVFIGTELRKDHLTVAPYKTSTTSRQLLGSSVCKTQQGVLGDHFSSGGIYSLLDSFFLLCYLHHSKYTRGAGLLVTWAYI